MRYLKVLAITMVALIELSYIAHAAPKAPTGTTNTPSSQQIFYYDNTLSLDPVVNFLITIFNPDEIDAIALSCAQIECAGVNPPNFGSCINGCTRQEITNRFSQILFDEFRVSFLQLTNTSNTDPVNVHVQIFASKCTNPVFNLETFRTECRGEVIICQEHDFVDFYTANDTHVYTMLSPGPFLDPFFPTFLFKNDPTDLTPLLPFDLEGTKGFVVITPIDAPGTKNAISHQHLIGTTRVAELFPTIAYRLNAMGRDAVNFTTAQITPDGTVLDGVNNGFITLQPDILKFNWTEFLGFIELFLGFESLGDFDINLSSMDLVSIAFRDNYDALQGYGAEPGDAVLDPILFDSDEEGFSCSPVPQNCFFNIGLNNDIVQADSLLGDQVLCPDFTFGFLRLDFLEGWAKLFVSGLDEFENELGLTGFVLGPGVFDFFGDGLGSALFICGLDEPSCTIPPDFPSDCTADCDPIVSHGEVDFEDLFLGLFGVGGASWMVAEGERTAVIEPPDCIVDTDCAEGEVCDAGACVDAPDCIVDADCAEGEVCDAGACVDAPDCIVDADCAEGEVCEAGACVEEVVVEGGGGGCAIASTATAGTTAVNALIVLIPLLGIGLRSMLRRRKED